MSYMICDYRSACGALVLLMALAMPVRAQVVTYYFTGTKTGGTPGSGTKISGSLTLDTAAAPNYFYDYAPGQYASWTDGNFTIQATTDNGMAAGSGPGRVTQFTEFDFPLQPFNDSALVCEYDDGGLHWTVGVFAIDHTTPGDGIADLPNPWNPTAKPISYLLISAYNGFGYNESATFSIDSFTTTPPHPATIVIDDRDTGIPDFLYRGRSVSSLLADCATGARNHGDYVKRVAALTNELKSAGLLTGQQKGLINSYAGQSSLGK